MHRLLIAVLRPLLPATRRAWADAMLAELEAVPEGVRRRRFAAGCVRVLAAGVITMRLRDWAAHPRTLAMALAGGFAIAALDQASETRRPMWIALAATSALLAWFRPAGAWRWGLLLATGIPILAAVNQAGGPYAFDRADAAYGIVPAVLVAMLVAFCRRRIPLKRTLLVAVGLVAGRTAQAQSAETRRALTAADVGTFADSAFADYLRRSSQPSLAFVVVKDGGILFSRGYGTEDAGGRRPVDPDSTVFWFASLSKLITADAVMREVERGRTAIGAPATAYLEWRLPSARASRAITVRDLLTHTHGLDEPFMQGTVDDPARLVPLGEYLAGLRWRAGARPGDLLRYSNHGMALAGYIVERTSGMPFAEYVEQEIFAPAGMTRSTFRQPVPAGLARRLATAGTDQALDYVLPAPAGAMVGTAGDMGRFLVAQLDTGGPHAARLGAMHATQWRGHPAVPGGALGWFETQLGGLPGLYHTGARHHFSVAWIAPSQRAGLLLVHSMRQGGPFQDLRTEVVRGFVQRYFADTAPAARTTRAPSLDGVYRPALLSATTVERAGYLLLDTRVRSTADGSIVMHAPGGLGTVIAHPIGPEAFEVRDGPQAGLRLGVVHPPDGPLRLVIGGTLLDPVVFTRLRWWQRGLVHAAALVVSCLALVLGAGAHGVHRMLARRRRTAGAGNTAWLAIGAGGAALLLATFALAAVIVRTPETGAAEHMRNGLRPVLALLSVGAAFGGAVPLATVLGWRRGAEGVGGRLSLCLLSAAGLVAAVLLWHYRLVGFHL
jgi:CubicO group peptidase (beta-lactamase class C family)